METNHSRRQPGAMPGSLETLIVTRLRDLVNGFKVRRVLPSVSLW